MQPEFPVDLPELRRLDQLTMRVPIIAGCCNPTSGRTTIYSLNFRNCIDSCFWQEKLEGPLHSVRVAHCNLIKPAELKALDGEFRLQ